MPGYLLHQSATVLCAHGGQAQPTAANPRVKVDGQPVVTQSGAYTIADCPQQPPIGPPCATAQWASAAARVKVEGTPVLLQDSQAVCTPTGTGLNVVATQARVKGT
jgi:uncharacterized Zn-binding protein involved in type VI secretion